MPETIKNPLGKLLKAKKVLVCSMHPGVVDWIKRFGVKDVEACDVRDIYDRLSEGDAVVGELHFRSVRKLGQKNIDYFAFEVYGADKSRRFFVRKLMDLKGLDGCHIEVTHLKTEIFNQARFKPCGNK